MDKEEIAGLISVFILLSLVVVIIILFIVFIKRKNKLIEAQAISKATFERELAETQIEIREETLRNISWELHDNIGQLLTLTKIQLQNANDNSDEVNTAVITLGNCLTELRSLSKLINPEVISSLSLIEALKLEIARYNRLKYLDATLVCNGDSYAIDAKIEIIIFRILQEFFTNTIKHSKATKLNVEVSISKDILFIKAEDNGIGFNTFMNESNKGIGISNIKNRAKLINADIEILSKVNLGTQLLLTYKF